MERQEVILSNDIETSLSHVMEVIPHDRLFVLTDENTIHHCWPHISKIQCMAKAKTITIGATDDNKTLESLVKVWTELQINGATRHSLMICLGGGMITDLGGFAASTFKRGIKFVNIPTTLLSMVDAAVGGKTGINFGGLKNEIGVFNPAQAVILDTEFLKTLDYDNIVSGYAEMLKHGLISNEQHWADLLRYDILDADCKALASLVAESVSVKERIVEADPTEQGIRKALNLGHTVGHAFESLAMEQGRTMLHGFAVAYGLVCELYLSTVNTGFPRNKFQQTISFIRNTFGTFQFDCKQYERLYELMTHDKKNQAPGEINFTMLADIGDIRINQTATKEEIFDMFDFYANL